MRDNPLEANLRDWQPLLREGFGYDTDLIVRHLRRLKSNAAALTAERLATAAGSTGRVSGVGDAKKSAAGGAGRVLHMPRTPDRKKRAASTKAKGARRQAKKDAR